MYIQNKQKAKAVFPWNMPKKQGSKQKKARALHFLSFVRISIFFNYSVFTE